jgi:hypothetical protein
LDAHASNSESLPSSNSANIRASKKPTTTETASQTPARRAIHVQSDIAG